MRNFSGLTPFFNICGKLLVCLLVFFVISCSTSSRDEARKAFLDEYPTYTLLGHETGEGWDGVVNYHYAFRKPGDEQVYAEIWTFERQKDGKWIVTGRWTPNEHNP